MQAQTLVKTRTGWRPGKHRFDRFILGAVIAIGLVVASILGIQALTDGETASETRHLSPVQLVEQDPPLPAGWTDPYFQRPVVFQTEDPPLPADWVDPYFEQSGAGFAGTAVRPDITALNLDQDGADVNLGLTEASGYESMDRAAAVDAIRVTEDHSVAGAVPNTVAQIQFLEANVWDYAPSARLAGEEHQPLSRYDNRFIEENTWGSPSPLPHGEPGTSY